MSGERDVTADNEAMHDAERTIGCDEFFQGLSEIALDSLNDEELVDRLIKLLARTKPAEFIDSPTELSPIAVLLDEEISRYIFDQESPAPKLHFAALQELVELSLAYSRNNLLVFTQEQVNQNSGIGISDVLPVLRYRLVVQRITEYLCTSQKEHGGPQLYSSRVDAPKPAFHEDDNRMAPSPIRDSERLA